ncbi:protein-methionine-sulfoxide reductase heme-binding subunit MsrQ [Roseovarius atlanticus]|uniref:protein-methionine-sulfoxide reductase heme-binding subunit MsrQ n=1 Tax=Roseovarius atlanticus TaxID=1641875 RepID=UPI001C958703|nr:protein-methionine-sulfoxide reductase heme-binding subunit MsrQ [Roseovarius atlanticus]MBY5989592.1 protein-methionine-sulfoxide reductase heme-binding subunit MsrQ [Roseovarius atlanticus]MBY6126137.1 protein-methionine-sulfoxide reductase heme-binding subunit MsrQ [Roseovarius atlanticus]MBY6150631.1 protein-methionine-sulfoxide reductase heme-binding subunit MsrQ [Roseovarius atlanticus]
MAAVDHINTGLRRVPAWPIYVASLGYAAWMLWLGIQNRLGADPVKVLEHEMGQMALYLLVAGLAVTPLRKLAGVNLLKFRRALGLACFFFVVCHLLVWAVLDVQRIGEVWADIVKRPYITVGMAAFVLLIPLAVTSNNLSIRKMGAAAWGRLHQLVYPAAILGGVHYVMLVKGWQIRPLVFLAVIAGLIAWRFLVKRKKAASRVQTAA